MRTTYCVLLLTCLGACASTTVRPGSALNRPTLTGFRPATPAESEQGRDKGNAPDDTMLAVGAGFTAGPGAFMLASTLDFPMDTNVTAGPSVQYAVDDDVTLMALTGQLKYFLPRTELGSLSVMPYLTGGIGLVTIDKESQGGDSGLLINLGAGVRYLTGEKYRIGSEVRLNFMPDEVSDEATFMSFDLLHVTFAF